MVGEYGPCSRRLWICLAECRAGLACTYLQSDLALHSSVFYLIGGYFDFSHLTELKNIYVTEIYIRKQYKSSKIKNKEITKKKIFFLMGVPLKDYEAS